MAEEAQKNVVPSAALVVFHSALFDLSLIFLLNDDVYII